MSYSRIGYTRVDNGPNHKTAEAYKLMIKIDTVIDTTRKPLPRKALADCAREVFCSEGHEDVSVLIILTDNTKVRQLGKDFLGHDYDTDVITFDLSEEDGRTIEGEIYIAVEYAEMQAKEYGVTLTKELKRLAVHGALHLCGYNDATDEERAAMGQKENMFI